MLDVSELSYHYPEKNTSTPVLSFSFSAKPGSITAILGPSGAGKSTLLSLLCGQLTPSAGAVRFDNDDFTYKTAHQRPLSILFQEHNLFSHLTVFDNIALGISPSLSLSHEQKAQVINAAEKVGLGDYISRQPSQLSGGQKQRVALARCLVRNRPLLLLDEPFSALDPSLRGDMLQQIKALAHTVGTTILMVTHHPHDAKAIADNVLFIDNGKVFYHAEIAELNSPPPHIQPYLM